MLTFKEDGNVEIRENKSDFICQWAHRVYQDRLHNLIDTDLGARDCNYSTNPSSVNDTVVI